MLLHATVRRCPTCEEATPHSRRIIAVPKVLSLASLAVAGWCFLGGSGGALLGGVLVGLALFLVLRDRERHWGIRCERCRRRKLAELRGTGPALGGSTEINIL